jgi:hypothetical protein
MRGVCVAYAWHMYGVCVAYAWRMHGVCVALHTSVNAKLFSTCSKPQRVHDVRCASSQRPLSVQGPRGVFDIGHSTAFMMYK